MTNIWILIFAFVYVGAVAAYIYLHKSSTNAQEFYLGNRNLSSKVMMFSLVVVPLGNYSMFMHPAYVFRDGFPYLIVATSSLIAMALAGVIFFKRQWALSKRFGYVTAGDMYFDYYQSKTLRLLVILISAVLCLTITVVQLNVTTDFFYLITNKLLPRWAFALIFVLLIAAMLFFINFKTLNEINMINCFLYFLFFVGLGLIAFNLLGGWKPFLEGITYFTKLKGLKWNLDPNSNFTDYVAILNVFGNDTSKDGYQNWSILLILTTFVSFFGLFVSPNLSSVSFSAQKPSSFINYHVWFSSLGLLIIFSFVLIFLGVGANLLGANTEINSATINISSILSGTLSKKNQELNLIYYYMNVVADSAPWFLGLLTITLSAVMFASIKFFLFTSSSLVSRDLMRILMKNRNYSEQLINFSVVVLFLLISFFIVTLKQNQIQFTFNFALACSAQLMVPLAGICYFKNFTPKAVIAGLVFGVLTVIVTDIFGVQLFKSLISLKANPLSINSVVWGLLINISICLFVSKYDLDIIQKSHRYKFHDFILVKCGSGYKEHSRIPVAITIVVVWILAALGPGLLIGNSLFGKNPDDMSTWTYGIPSLWFWEIMMGILGAIMIWYLAKPMNLLGKTAEEIVSLKEDYNN